LDLSVDIGNMRLQNPVTLASGTAGYGEELAEFIDISRLGALFTKGLSLEPRLGNRGNRIIETPSGMLNSIGLENVGIERFLNEKLPFLMAKKARVIPNVAGHTIDENAELCRLLSNAMGIEAIELNVSCPNVKEGGIAFGADIRIFTRLLEKVRKVTTVILIVKLSPNVTDIAEFAHIAEASGADAVSAVNTFIGMKIDVKSRRPYFNNRVAGLSGPAIRPLAVRAVYEVFERVTIPIIGIGGISGVEDILEFIMAGASVVSIGTMNMVDPLLSIECIEGLRDYLVRENIDSMRELIGIAH
jgi:dihydroorotate dehydrogenase (NAD+) catalytic subunit